MLDVAMLLLIVVFFALAIGLCNSVPSPAGCPQ